MSNATSIGTSTATAIGGARTLAAGRVIADGTVATATGVSYQTVLAAFVTIYDIPQVVNLVYAVQPYSI